MTYEHAIKQLEDDALFKGASEEINPLYAAYTVAIDAMEKQIPTKVSSSGLTDKCGSCMESLTHQSKYCPWCGQRLDWERHTENDIDPNRGDAE